MRIDLPSPLLVFYCFLVGFLLSILIEDWILKSDWYAIYKAKRDRNLRVRLRLSQLENLVREQIEREDMRYRAEELMQEVSGE